MCPANTENTSYKTWLDQIKKENPWLDVSKPAYTFGDSSAVSAFPHADNIQGMDTTPLIPKPLKIQTGAKICNLNQLRAAFDGGAEYVYFEFGSNDQWTPQYVLDHIDTEYVYSRFEFIDPDSLQLSCGLEKCKNCCLSVPAKYNHNISPTQSQEFYLSLSMHTDKWADTFTQLQEVCDAISKNAKLKKWCFDIYFHEDFLLTIAFVRAIRKVIRKISQDYGIDLNCRIQAMLPFDQSDTNQISPFIPLSTMTLAAYLGSCEYLCVFEKNASAGGYFRNAVLVQQVCKYESYLDKVMDPLAGSYLLEQMADQLSNNWWLKLSY